MRQTSGAWTPRVEQAVAERLMDHKEEALRVWESLVLKEIPHARAYDQSALRDSLHKFIDQIIAALDMGGIEPVLKIEKRIARRHGEQRVETSTYTLDQVLTKYRLLRKAIFQVLEGAGDRYRESTGKNQIEPRFGQRFVFRGTVLRFKECMSEYLLRDQNIKLTTWTHVDLSTS